MRGRRTAIVVGAALIAMAGGLVAFAATLSVTSKSLGAKSVPTSLTTTSTTSAGVTNFLVTAPTGAVAGTAFNVTIQARIGVVNDATFTGQKCLTFTGPGTSPGPVATAPSYPAQGTCPATKSSVTFTGTGSATVPVTLFKAETVALMAASGGRTGTSGSINVDSKGVTLTRTHTCPTTHTKNTTQTYGFNVPNDEYGNPFRSAAGLAVSMTLTGGDSSNYKFDSSGNQAATLTITTGPANTTYTVTESGAKKDTTLTASVPGGSGFTAPADCSLVGTV